MIWDCQWRSLDSSREGMEWHSSWNDTVPASSDPANIQDMIEYSHHHWTSITSWVNRITRARKIGTRAGQDTWPVPAKQAQRGNGLLGEVWWQKWPQPQARTYLLHWTLIKSPYVFWHIITCLVRNLGVFKALLNTTYIYRHGLSQT